MTPDAAAQTKSRAEVKSDTKASLSTNDAAKTGEVGSPMPMPKGKGDVVKSRADVKAETKAAAKAGELPTGDSGMPKSAEKKPKSEKSRAAVKAEVKKGSGAKSVE